MSLLTKHKVFISYHHANDQQYKDSLLQMNALYDIFIDKSVDTGDVEDNLSDQEIRVKIRDEYLRDSTVTILLAGTQTMFRKHVDWEIFSSMYDGEVNKKSGILVVNLPLTGSDNITAGHGNQEKQLIHPNIDNWISLNRSQYEQRYPYLPNRIIDNLVNKNSKISVVPWGLIDNRPEILKLLIEFTNQDRQIAEYDLSRPMKRQN